MNSITGIVIWEDWRVIQSWPGYICVFVLLGLGCDLLLSEPQLNNDNPDFGLRATLQYSVKEENTRRWSDSSSSPETFPLNTRASLSRVEAWKSVVVPPPSDIDVSFRPRTVLRPSAYF